VAAQSVAEEKAPEMNDVAPEDGALSTEVDVVKYGSPFASTHPPLKYEKRQKSF
jgi:hypothetical protein